MRGKHLGPYVLEGELGRGGMGVVLRARDPAGRAVAVKRLVVRDEELARRLLRESDIRIEHENVVRVLGAGLDEEGEPYVVTELLEGETLAAALAHGLELPRIVELFAEAADGLAALHAHGVVHRDIKPSNLFVTERGTLKVLDFGIATAREGASLLTATGALVGTPAYASPEQARGERSLDARSDVWSLGMSLYEALTGSLPFRREGAVATALAVERDPLPRLGARAPEVPFELALLVERCLCRDPADRPESAAELARLLRAIPSSAVGRPSQPLFRAGDAAFRSVVGLLATVPLGAAATSLPSGAQLLLFGAGVARGDEVDRAIEHAMPLARRARLVIATVRVREPEGTIDEAALGPALGLLVGRPGVVLTNQAAALRHRATLTIGEEGVSQVTLSEEIDAGERFVGRDDELETLESRITAALEGARPTVTCVIGEPGLGKSALLRALAERVGAVVPGATAILVEARRHAGTPLGALVRALLVDPRAEGGIEVARDARRVAVLDRIGERLVDTAGVVVLVDDLDHAETATRALILELPSLFDGRPLAVVATARAALEGSVDAALSGTAALDDVALGPMPTAALRAMLEAQLGRAALDAARLGAVVERAGGNPLFAEQLAKSALAPSGASDLPPTVERAVQSQLDVLERELSSAARSLSVVGAEGGPIAARAALGARAGALTTRLEDAGVLAAPSAVGTWRFKHRIVADVAYASIDPEVARRLHRELAQRLADAGGVAPDEVLHHADRGGDAELGARFVREALFAAARIGDGPRVLALIDRARTPASDAFPCLLLAAEAAAFVRGSEAAETLLDDALRRAREPDERAHARIELAEHLRRRGFVERARRELEEALREATAPEIRARAACRVALAEVSAGAPDRALASLELDGLAALTPAVRALVSDTRGYVEGARGALGGARLAYERAGALYAEAGDVRRAAGANANLGETMRAMGNLASAERTLRRAIDGARRVGNGLTAAYAMTNLGAVLLALERSREGLATLEVAATRASTVGDARLGRMVVLVRALAERRDALPAELEESVGDRTLHTTALALRLAFGNPSERELDEAEALLAGDGGIEEGTLEIGRALLARRPTPHATELVFLRLDRIARSIGDPAWTAQFVDHVERALGSVASPWATRRRF